jgi:hypothetical protein
MSEFAPKSLGELAKFCQEHTDDEKLIDKLTLAEEWATSAHRYGRQYNQALQESILPGLQYANNGDRNNGQYWEEGKALVFSDFEVVIGAAEILSKLWEDNRTFIAWTKDAPYVNNYGNWIDPKNEIRIEDDEHAEQIRRERLAA